MVMRSYHNGQRSLLSPSALGMLRAELTRPRRSLSLSSLFCASFALSIPYPMLRRIYDPATAFLICTVVYISLAARSADQRRNPVMQYPGSFSDSGRGEGYNCAGLRGDFVPSEENEG